MAAFGADTSVVIATLCSWHEAHERAVEALSLRLDSGADLVLAAHSLLETYSVLTHLPPPHRISPAVACELLRRNFADLARIVGLPIRGHWSLIRRAPALGVAGGRTYDAAIAATLDHAVVTELLTLNPTHFEGLLGDGVLIVSP